MQKTDVTMLDRPANCSDLNPMENMWSIAEKKKRDTTTNIADDPKVQNESDSVLFTISKHIISDWLTAVQIF